MSPRVKNLRRYSPRARWKIDVPLTIVLSTSKNAAAPGSAGTASAASTSAADVPPRMAVPTWWTAAAEARPTGRVPSSSFSGPAGCPGCGCDMSVTVAIPVAVTGRLRSSSRPGSSSGYPGRVSSPDLRSSPSSPSSPSSQPRITLIGKPGCHLCDEAKIVIERVVADTGVGWRELSILDDPGLAERYWEQIPVILVDGEQHDFYRVDEARLRAVLRGREHRRRRR
jgi:hypothetical protein